jgi:multidrug transporter EmrE-like cation transporter
MAAMRSMSVGVRYALFNALHDTMLYVLHHAVYDAVSETCSSTHCNAELIS